MPINFSPILTNAAERAATFNAPLQQLDNAIKGLQNLTVGPTWTNVMSDQYGATGDGSTDDSAAIQAALNAAGANGRIYFPKPPSYYKAKALTPLQGQTLEGSWLGSNIQYIGGNVPIFAVTNGNITFRNLEIAHPSPSGNEGVCVKITGPLNSVRFLNVWLASAYSGVKSVGGGEFYFGDGTVVEAMAGPGLWFQGSYDIRVVGCWLGLNGNPAILTGTNGGTRTRNLIVVGNTFDANSQDAIQFSSSDNLAVVGNVFDSNGQQTDNTYNDITLFDATGITVSGNSGPLDSSGTSKVVAYNVYAYANVAAAEISLLGNRWVIGKSGEIYYAAGVIDGSTHAFAVPREQYGTGAPTAGTWRVGDRVWSVTPASGAAPGWVCTAAGTPGTWKAMANLA